MNSFINFWKEILMIKQDDSIKVGLTQFKTIPKPIKKEASIRNKDVKLSDLMRRAG